VACVSADDFRWEKAHIKSTSLLGSVFARQISFDAGALETVMFRRGYLSEAAASNVWVVKDGTVYGTPKDNLVLEGIRYGLIEELCRSLGIAFRLRASAARKCWRRRVAAVVSATKEVLPVTTLDGEPVGTLPTGNPARSRRSCMLPTRCQAGKTPMTPPPQSHPRRRHGHRPVNR
jgi:D-alanine transaminase